jgi:hypothetical protein
MMLRVQCTGFSQTVMLKGFCADGGNKFLQVFLNDFQVAASVVRVFFGNLELVYVCGTLKNFE